VPDAHGTVQAVNAGNPILVFDVMQTTLMNHQTQVAGAFRKRHTCCVNIAQRPSELLTDRPQFAPEFACRSRLAMSDYSEPAILN
jgi:hypothetical protein